MPDEDAYEPERATGQQRDHLLGILGAEQDVRLSSRGLTMSVPCHHRDRRFFLEDRLASRSDDGDTSHCLATSGSASRLAMSRPDAEAPRLPPRQPSRMHGTDGAR